MSYFGFYFSHLYMYVSCSGSITSVLISLLSFTVIMYFLFGEVSSWCFGWAALFYYGIS